MTAGQGRVEGPRRALPAEHLDLLDRLAESYLRETDPIRASGFGGGAARWRAEREPILSAVERSGSLMDVGCANGFLLECLLRWARERGIDITPHGVDRSGRLVELARARLPEFAGNLHVGDSWTWVPPVRCDYVYALYDCVPVDFLSEYIDRLLDLAVAPGGRLILGAYGSRSRGLTPFDIAGFVQGQGLEVLGTATGGEPPVAAFAWLNACGRSA